VVVTAQKELRTRGVGVALLHASPWHLHCTAIAATPEASFQEYDALIEPETEPPMAPLKTGSRASLLAWDKLGRAGREFITSGPTREDVSVLSGRAALSPVRVYVGLRSADTPEVRAKLALEELKRVGGFERSVLIVVTPTGTGWVDPAPPRPMDAPVTAWFEYNRCLTFGAPQPRVARRSIGVGIGGWATQKNKHRCRTAADWFVLRSEQTSYSPVFGERHAVLVSRLRH
jgi:hypothetical protein